MARKRIDKAMGVESADITVASLEEGSSALRAVPLVFISHDSRDADLAEAFDHLLTDASGGVVQTFRSSDQTGRAGIDYGENWFSKITAKLGDATDVVALLTPNSVGRPWILFEAGFAVGRLDSKVFGIAMGLSLSKAVSGPFAQFQNCEANEDSLTTVVLKLIQRNPNARPREQAVRKQVGAFLGEISPLLNQRQGTEEETKEDMDATAVAKLFEEVKIMFRDLPSKVQSELRGHGVLRRRRKFHPMMFEEIFHVSHMEGASPSLPWLMLASILREDVPWVADAAVE
ncbi:MAG TPA: TIR domain-containing protein, partial [Thermoanaerobaculia bacterium]